MNRLTSFRHAVRGNTLFAFALLSPFLMLLTGGVIDYANSVRIRTALQAVADGAALSAAKELRLSRTSNDNVLAAAEGYAHDALPYAKDLLVSGGITETSDGVTVNLTQRVPLILPPSINLLPGTVSAKAEAKAYGGAPMCLLGLDPEGDEVVHVSDAGISAPECTVQANSSSPHALKVNAYGRISAATICTGGGVKNEGGTLDPAVKLDCPKAEDPLAGRPAPPVGGCDYDDKRVIGFAVLQPGVYCKGLRITTAYVQLNPGIYIIKDGPLLVENGSQLRGQNVGFFFTGTDARFTIDPFTVISLTAPKNGTMAGLLFYEDRKNDPVRFEMFSLNAPVLLGTFYLPKSELQIGTLTDTGVFPMMWMARQSAWTIIVANKVIVSNGLDLVLNSDYRSTNIPVPPTLGGRVALVR